MARMPTFDEIRADFERGVRTAEQAIEPPFRRHAPAAQAAVAVTIRTSTPGGPVSKFTDDLHAVAARLERYDEEALAKFEAVQASGVTKELFSVVSGLTHVDPTPEFNAVVTLLKAFVPQQQPVPQGEPSFTPAGPQVAGQA